MKQLECTGVHRQSASLAGALSWKFRREEALSAIFMPLMHAAESEEYA